VLEVEGLVAGYGAFQVLHGLDLSLATGEVVAVLGSNGVGKTTLNRVLSGLVPARAGRVRFLDRDLTGLDHAEIVAMGLIHVPEGRRVFPNLTVRENLLLGATVRGRRERGRTMEGVLHTFPRLRERLSQHAGSMSGGEQQMLAIGRGLMGLPRLLILDEPSLGLSPKLVEELFALIGDLHRQGLSILLVEQNVVQSLGIANRAYVIEHGRVAIEGHSAALLEDERLRAAYLGM
jgi:branched-chain amino acid transport system ATP-binding protein